MKYLRAQVLYKLQQYEEARALYETVLKETQDVDDLMDVLTNYLACLSQIPDSNLSLFEELASKLPGQKSYELLFNLSLVQLRKNMVKESLETLRVAY